MAPSVARIALVTGANKGMGLDTIARQLGVYQEFTPTITLPA